LFSIFQILPAEVRSTTEYCLRPTWKYIDGKYTDQSRGSKSIMDRGAAVIWFPVRAALKESGLQYLVLRYTNWIRGG